MFGCKHWGRHKHMLPKSNFDRCKQVCAVRRGQAGRAEVTAQQIKSIGLETWTRLSAQPEIFMFPVARTSTHFSSLPATLNHRVTLEKADRKSAEREQCWSFLNPPARGSRFRPSVCPARPRDAKSASAFWHAAAQFHLLNIQPPRRPARCGVRARGDHCVYSHSAHNHSHWWCAQSTNQISKSGAQSTSDRYNPPVCHLTVAFSPRVSFSTAPLLICVRLCNTTLPNLCSHCRSSRSNMNDCLYLFVLVRLVIAIAFWG